MSRSSSSSPDVLQPPGDADYIISSPFKPFRGRQSFMSPANFRPLHTPRKRQRVSTSPSKSSHSIKFDDVLLPASPTLKLNGQPRQPSPENLPSDGNVSPWRIRVTLEATQDENENQGSPGRKRRMSPTKTTKVPLRDEQDNATPTPKRRRGRPRKSVQGEGTPIPGSPGHTPGPRGTEQKRKRGRPRKSVPEAPDNPPEDTEMRDPTPVESGQVEPGQRWSPLNIAADGGSDDGLPDNMPADPFEFDQGGSLEARNPETQPDGRWDRSSPRVTFMPQFDTPDVGAIDREYDDDQHLYSTPSKMPSSRGSNAVSPENTLHAGHTPGPTTYPTPSSSQVDEERQEHETHPIVSGDGFPSAPSADDPTDDHREFDSIVESEEFSMVSLDTLPSAKQHGLSGSKKLTKGPLKPFLEREAIGITDRKRRAHRVNGNDEHLSPNKHVLESPPRHSRSPASDLQAANGAIDVFEPGSPPTRTRRPASKLARIVRVGVALGGTMRQAGTLDFEIEGSRKRLGALFDGFYSEIKQDLQSGLLLGQELAKRLIQLERERLAALEANAEEESQKTPQQREPSGRNDSVDSRMRMRMEEWQREREAISREIEMANSSQVIVIDSDSDNPQSARNDDYDQHESEEEPEPEQELEGPSEGPSEDDYEDIWQEEAKDQSHISHRSSMNRPEHHPVNQHQLSSHSDPPSDDVAPLPTEWGNNHTYLGRSRVKQLREEQVDLSPLFRGEYTPRRYQYYFGKGSPSSAGGLLRQQPVDAVDEQIQTGAPDLATVENQDQTRYERHSLHSDQDEGQNEDSPEPDQLTQLEEEDEYQADFAEVEDTVEREVAQSQNSDSPGDEEPAQQEEDEYQADSPEAEGPVQQDEEDEYQEDSPEAEEPAPASAQSNVTVTPQPPRQTNSDIQSSSWFQRLTNFTPGWLKAPTDQPANPGSKEPTIPEDPDDIEESSDDNDDDDEEEEEEEEEEETPKPPRLREPSLPTQSHPQSQPQAHPRPKPLPLTGYFTNAHYAHLRHLYRISLRNPHLFPHHRTATDPSDPDPDPDADILGDWIWTSDGKYGVQITASQFGVVDRFAAELVEADIQYRGDGSGGGGGGVLGWSRDELHRRLISIIIGEQVRADRREMGVRVPRLSDVGGGDSTQDQDQDQDQDHGQDQDQDHGQDQMQNGATSRETSVDIWLQ